MRLIYADDAEKALAEQMAYEARTEYGGRQRAKDYLLIARAYFQNCPTIEAEPVRRGHWKVVDEAEPKRYGCSECKVLSFYLYHYCPCCGAKMEDE